MTPEPTMVRMCKGTDGAPPAEGTDGAPPAEGGGPVVAPPVTAAVAKLNREDATYNVVLGSGCSMACERRCAREGETGRRGDGETGGGCCCSNVSSEW